MNCRSLVVIGGVALILWAADSLRQHPGDKYLTFDVSFIGKHLAEIEGQIQQTALVSLLGGDQFFRAVCVHAFKALDRFRVGKAAV